MYGVRFAGGFATEQRLSPTEYLMCELLHEQTSVAAAADRFAARTERPTDQANTEMIDFVRQGLMRGLLEPGPAERGD